MDNLSRWEDQKIWDNEKNEGEAVPGCDRCTFANGKHGDDCECCCHLTRAEIYGMQCDEVYNRANNK